ncbi:MAG: 4Fe-4S ferredoxin [Desulfobacterales bacterium]|nr:4Fe-4S ferredoxin [Desulfobacterales bacterium]
MKIMRKIIEIDDERCDGCGECVPGCAEGALQIVDGKARMISDNLCDGLGACIGECPNDALKIIEREADDFDEVAVEKHLSQQKAEEKPVMAHGCPSAKIQTLAPSTPCQAANKPGGLESAASTLSHWPIQIRLIPPTAPFLKGADLLVLADCCAAAYPAVQELMKGRVVMMGCPKFDDAQDYVNRFSEIFKAADVKSVTSVIMEVPCCGGLPMIVGKGMENAGKTIPMETLVISTRGERVEK